MRRTFDLLTALLAENEGEHLRTYLAWKNPRNFRVEIAKQVQELFDVVGNGVLELATSDVDRDKFLISVQRRVDDRGPARFAAIVSCDTDETELQEESKIEWPQLVQEIAKIG